MNFIKFPNSVPAQTRSAGPAPTPIYSLKFLDKTLQEGPQDSSSGTAPLTSTLTHMTLSLKTFFSVFAYCKRSKVEAGMAWEQGYKIMEHSRDCFRDRSLESSQDHSRDQSLERS